MGSGGRLNQVQILSLPFSSCVTMGTLPHISVLICPRVCIHTHVLTTYSGPVTTKLTHLTVWKR